MATASRKKAARTKRPDVSFAFGANAKRKAGKAGRGGPKVPGTNWNGAGTPNSGGGSIKA